MNNVECLTDFKIKFLRKIDRRDIWQRQQIMVELERVYQEILQEMIDMTYEGKVRESGEGEGG